MLYLGFGSTLGARGPCEHTPYGVFASETAQCNSVLNISVELCSLDLPVGVLKALAVFRPFGKSLNHTVVV